MARGLGANRRPLLVWSKCLPDRDRLPISAHLFLDDSGVSRFRVGDVCLVPARRRSPFRNQCTRARCLSCFACSGGKIHFSSSPCSIFWRWPLHIERLGHRFISKEHPEFYMASTHLPIRRFLPRADIRPHYFSRLGRRILEARFPS